MAEFTMVSMKMERCRAPAVCLSTVSNPSAHVAHASRAVGDEDSVPSLDASVRLVQYTVLDPYLTQSLLGVSPRLVLAPRLALSRPPCPTRLPRRQTHQTELPGSLQAMAPLPGAAPAPDAAVDLERNCVSTLALGRQHAESVLRASAVLHRFGGHSSIWAPSSCLAGAFVLVPAGSLPPRQRVGSLAAPCVPMPRFHARQVVSVAAGEAFFFLGLCQSSGSSAAGQAANRWSETVGAGAGVLE